MAEHERHVTPEASWTDGLEDKMRVALAELDQPTHGGGPALLKRLLEAPKPDGWHWEG